MRDRPAGQGGGSEAGRARRAGRREKGGPEEGGTRAGERVRCRPGRGSDSEAGRRGWRAAVLGGRALERCGLAQANEAGQWWGARGDRRTERVWLGGREQDEPGGESEVGQARPGGRSKAGRGGGEAGRHGHGGKGATRSLSENDPGRGSKEGWGEISRKRTRREIGGPGRGGEAGRRGDGSKRAAEREPGGTGEGSEASRQKQAGRSSGEKG
jgi:hypothetical protein